MADMNPEQITKKTPFVIALIPAYNESEKIGSVIAETSKFVNSIVVVDDGSADKTKDVATTLNAIVVRNKRNMGKGFALKRGIIECLKHNPDIIVTIDADGQHDGPVRGSRHPGDLELCRLRGQRHVRRHGRRRPGVAAGRT